MKACEHKAPDDFSQWAQDKRVWKCSSCKTEDIWSEHWWYLGTLECKKCGYPEMEFVNCGCKDHE